MQEKDRRFTSPMPMMQGMHQLLALRLLWSLMPRAVEIGIALPARPVTVHELFVELHLR